MGDICPNFCGVKIVSLSTVRRGRVAVIKNRFLQTNNAIVAAVRLAFDKSSLFSFNRREVSCFELIFRVSLNLEHG